MYLDRAAGVVLSEVSIPIGFSNELQHGTVAYEGAGTK